MRNEYKHLGYVTPAMFCREELGISGTAAWDSVHLAEGMLPRPILLQAFLDGRLAKSHALELLRPGPEEDPSWAARATMPIPDLRRELKALRQTAAGAEREPVRVRTFELEVDAYAAWLAALELSRRREGRDLGPANALEQIAAEFLSGRPPRPAWELERWDGPPAPTGKVDAGDTTTPRVGGRNAASPAAEAPYTRATDIDARKVCSPPGKAQNPGSAPDGTAPADATGAAPPDASSSEPELPRLLRKELPRPPRKLTNLARRLLRARDQVELQQGRLLRRVQEGRLYREVGHRSFRAWLQGRGIAPSTAFQCTARDQVLERHPALRQALCQGSLTATKIDLLVRLPKRAEPESWMRYAENHTCRRLEEAVEAALVLATRHPRAWHQRLGTAPDDLDSIAEFREQAGLDTLEDTCDSLVRALQQAASGRATHDKVQTSGGTSDTPPTVQTSAQPPATPDKVQTSAGSVSACTDQIVVTARIPAVPDAKGQPPASAVPEAASNESSGSGSTIRLRLVLPESVDKLWRQAEAELRLDHAEPLSPEDCLHVLCLAFLGHGGQETQRQSRVRRQALERAGYRCEAPGCACRTNLHVHHIVRRSQGGSDDLSNLCVVCVSHHLRHLHGGTMSVDGDSPYDRIWEIGLRDGRPWRIYCDDCVVVRGAPVGEPPPNEDENQDLDW